MNHAAKLVNKLKHPSQPNMLWFFSDEKNLCQDLMINSQSYFWLALSPQDVLIAMKTKHIIYVMVFGVVTSDGNVMLLFIFPYGFRLNTVAYIKCLVEVVLSWIKTLTIGTPYIWQHDFAPCHTSKRIQSWLSENFCNHTAPNIWPSNSLDCNSLDYVKPTKIHATPKMNWRQG